MTVLLRCSDEKDGAARDLSHRGAPGLVRPQAVDVSCKFTSSHKDFGVAGRCRCRGRLRSMAVDPENVRDQALSLPTEARARLAVDLLHSLDDEIEPDGAEYDAAWGTEIEERLRAVDTGQVKPVPWAEARERISRET